MAVVRLATDDAITSTTKSNVLGMAFTVPAATNYAFEFNLFTSANAATVGVQFALTYDGTISAARAVLQGPTSTSALGWHTATSFPMSFNPTASQGNVVALVVIAGLVEALTGGTLQLQHGSETATLTTVHQGSWGVGQAV